MTSPTPAATPATALRRRLGLDDTADDAVLLAAVDEALAERADTPRASPNVVMLDRQAHDELVAAAEHGRTVQARETRARHGALVDAAVRDGRITPARRAAWASVLERTPAAAEDLAALPPGMAVPLEARGHDAGPGTGAHVADGWFDDPSGRRTG